MGTTQSTSASPSCGFVPKTCQRPLEKNFGRLTTKTYRKFQEITGVSQDVASLEDMQLYFFCRQRNEKKCAGLEAPCSCSSPPCVCPGGDPVVSSLPPTNPPATTSTMATTTSTTT